MPLVVIEDKDITFRNSEVVLEVDTEAKSFKELEGGAKLFFDTEIDPYKIETAVQHGKVRYVPTNTFSGENKITKGDTVYCHHFLLDRDDSAVKLEIAGELLYPIKYESIYAIYRSQNDIEMLTKWNFIEPIKEVKIKSTLLIDQKEENIDQWGIARFINEDLRKLGVKEGDKLFLAKNSEYEIDIDGTVYYRVENDDIYLKID